MVLKLCKATLTCPSRRNGFPGRIPAGGDGDLTTHPAGRGLRHSDMGNPNNQGLRFRLVTPCPPACPVPTGAPRNHAPCARAGACPRGSAPRSRKITGDPCPQRSACSARPVNCDPPACLAVLPWPGARRPGDKWTACADAAEAAAEIRGSQNRPASRHGHVPVPDGSDLPTTPSHAGRPLRRSPDRAT
jgi:hypothetical protein